MATNDDAVSLEVGEPAEGQAVDAGEEHSEQREATPEADPDPPACPLLEAVYGKNSLPLLELAPGLPMSPVIAAVWPDAPAEELLKHNWISQPAEDAPEDAPAPPAFDPTSCEYSVLPIRLAKSKPLRELNKLKKLLRDKEDALNALVKPSEEESTAAQNAVDEVKTQLEETQAAFVELKTAIVENPLSMVGWMNALFAAADAGMTTMIISGQSWPHCKLDEAFSEAHGSELTIGVEKMLRQFKECYVRERGPGSVQIVLRMTPNVFRDGVTAEGVDGMVARLQQSAGIDPEGESAESLDAVEVAWWDAQALDPIATLQKLSKLTVDETETDPESGEVTVTAAKKIKALGVYNFSPKEIMAAIQAGVHISFAHVSMGLHEAKQAQEVIALCKEYEIKVFADNATMHGLVDSLFVGVPCPSAFEDGLPLTSMPDAVTTIESMGGWDKVQSALQVIKEIASARNVTMQTVMLRWQMDCGAVPSVQAAWDRTGVPFGHRDRVNPPYIDAGLFDRKSPLLSEDIQRLQALAV